MTRTGKFYNLRATAMPRQGQIVTVRTDVLMAELARRNITAREFARRVKTTEATISRILSGKRVPSTELRKRIMAELRMGFDDLFLLDVGEPVRK